MSDIEFEGYSADWANPSIKELRTWKKKKFPTDIEFNFETLSLMATNLTNPDGESIEIDDLGWDESTGLVKSCVNRLLGKPSPGDEDPKAGESSDST